MKRVSIERYKTPTSGYAGCIEGETDDGQQWIMFMDESGKPEVFWPDRDPDGGVSDWAIALTTEAHDREVQMRRDKMRDILDNTGTPEDIVVRLRAALQGPERFKEEPPEVRAKIKKIRDMRIFGREVTPEKPKA